MKARSYDAIRAADPRNIRRFARREDAAYFGAWRAYYKAVVEAGIYAGVKPLDAPETGTTVRRRDGKSLL
jgi:hypothetical protein